MGIRLLAHRQPCFAVFTVSVVLVLLAACSSPLDRDDSASNGTGPAETATVPVMPVVTPTPVDPAQLASDATSTPEVVEVPDVYVVTEGDTLYNIAARFRVEIQDLVEENGLSDPNDIYVGQELTIPKR